MTIVELAFGRFDDGEQVADEQCAPEGEHEERQQIVTEEHLVSVWGVVNLSAAGCCARKYLLRSLP